MAFIWSDRRKTLSAIDVIDILPRPSQITGVLSRYYGVGAQGLIAYMLGVHRERVTAAASKLQAEGIVQCGRGRIKVLDRLRLLKGACECYVAIRKEYDSCVPRPLARIPNCAPLAGSSHENLN